MKKLSKTVLVLLTLSIIASSCGTKQNGQLIGVSDRPSWSGINPYGMVYVPSGTLHIGPSDQDVSQTYIQRPKSISIQGFYMDDTEITNNEWRQFVFWVRDSLAHTALGNVMDDEETGEEKIDWEMEIDWESEELEDLYYSGDDRFAGRKELDTRNFVYNYEWYNWQAAAHNKDPDASRGSFILRDEANIYPDTLVWVRDFAYSYNEPFTRNYFWHPAFDDYPVVGIDWKMANAFCYWRTKLWNLSDEVNSEDFRLPTEHEWEYAARGGHEHAPYPWGGYYVRNAKGCLLANFKPGRGNYPEDGGFYTVKADAYFPNDYGLYNMAGNVSEWTSSAFHENSYSFIHDLNPDFRYDAADEEPEAQKRKVIRGGSWKDIAFFMQTGTRHWEFQDTTKSYIGFRCALTFLGRSINDF
ncbi:MAG: SUMF1/EgtB/PvdO family nonheme iron enzyme [Saprospiraceae bacterium]